MDISTKLVYVPAMFKPRKAAQVVAFFALHNGGPINVLKLTKLVYLADREFMRLHDFPILGDHLVSMPHGPVNSATYNYINRDAQSDDWSRFVHARNGYNVSITNAAKSTDDLDELSRAEVKVLEKVWTKFGALDQFALRDWTHQNCKEWRDPNGSSIPIPYERVLECLGKSEAESIAAEIESKRELAGLFGD